MAWIVGAVLGLAAIGSVPLVRANLRHGHHERPPHDGPPGELEDAWAVGSMDLDADLVLHHEPAGGWPVDPVPWEHLASDERIEQGPLSPAGYLRGLDRVFGHVTSTGPPRCASEDDELCADEECPVHGLPDDAPWSVIEHEPTAAEVAASRAAHGYIPELDPGPETVSPGPDQDGGGQVVLRNRTPQGPLPPECIGGAGSTPALAAADILGPRARAVLDRYEGRRGARKWALT